MSSFLFSGWFVRLPFPSSLPAGHIPHLGSPYLLPASPLPCLVLLPYCCDVLFCSRLSWAIRLCYVGAIDVHTLVFFSMGLLSSRPATSLQSVMSFIASGVLLDNRVGSWSSFSVSLWVYVFSACPFDLSSNLRSATGCTWASFWAVLSRFSSPARLCECLLPAVISNHDVVAFAADHSALPRLRRPGKHARCPCNRRRNSELGGHFC